MRPVDGALRRVDRADGKLLAYVLEREVLGDQLGGIELNAYGGFLLAADRDLTDAWQLADLLGKHGVGDVIDLDQRQHVGGDGQQQDRRVRRVDLAIGRRGREIGRKLAGGGVDGRLDVVCRRVDVSVEIELDGDARGAEPVRGSRLRHARDLRELTLEGLGDRRRHGLRARAGQLR